MKNEEIKSVEVTYGVVLAADIATIQRLQDILSDMPGCRVIYHRTSGGRLTIVEGDDARK